ncbi:polysaccharide deacetylase family protein [Paraliomyxa miuraensis]|uniref:polysaccharide deacetylase family protein n=1 Tax=Paraliomyxa miuraensis TaxID=376150 RepID=UPI002253BFB2|nr:polysaccharide deacetylase family protein [Paraliomyxa miuraensis]MCX4244809.1 polysaccharide deacetylase family protein [Paraliomyxa miuraensis]
MPALPATLISVDLDDVACYHAIHGLPPPSPSQCGVGLTRWLPRFLELFARTGVRATFFVIGRDLQRDLEEGGEGAALLRQAVEAGHELGNHSFSHAYDLVRMPAAAQREDLRACDALLRGLGAEVMGFRAPGYTHDAGLLRQAAALGHRYDSSCLPSAPYYAAKLAVMGAMALRGERSSSQWRGAGSFLGSRLPYWREDVALWELPMSVSPVTRVPLIGTTLLALPAVVAGALRRTALGLPHFHLELHGIDLGDAERDGLSPGLARRQPELRVPWRVRHERLRELLVLRGGGTALRDAVR